MRVYAARDIPLQVILFYALLIGGIAAVVTAYVTFLIGPIGMIARRFGVVASAAYAVALAAALYTLYEPPFGGLSLNFAPAGMRPNLFIVGFFEDPPVPMLVAGAIVSAIGWIVVLLAWLTGRDRRGSG